MALFCLVCLICALKLNICLVIIHSTLVVCFCLLTGSFWHAAEGSAAIASRLQIVSLSLFALRSRSTKTDASTWAGDQ
jgi:succinate-acetate transporter protein